MILHALTICAGFAVTGAPAAAKAPVQPTAKPAQPAATPPAAKPAAKATTPVADKSDAKATVKPTSFALHQVELDVAAKTNAERARYGLPPLTLDPSLVNTSRRHTWWMVRNRIFQHGNYPVAENIAMGQRSSSEAVRSWMNSSGHRANILNRSNRRMGVAAYTTPSGTTYWTQQFSR